jgi:hypothetical protein
MTWPAPHRVLSAFRRRRATAAGFFVLLALLVGTERRLAELHYNQRAGSPALESDDVLDGDEIRVRLVVLNDDKAPTLSDVGRIVVAYAVQVVPRRREACALGRPAPRGPPSISSSRV